MLKRQHRTVQTRVIGVQKSTIDSLLSEPRCHTRTQEQNIAGHAKSKGVYRGKTSKPGFGSGAFWVAICRDLATVARRVGML